MNGNKTNNQEIDLYPFLHNQPNINAHKNANINLINTAKRGIRLNNISIQLNTEKAKYNLAGVQSLLKSVSIYI
jgi:hypothetical protein